MTFISTYFRIKKYPIKIELFFHMDEHFFQVMSEIGDLVDHIDEILGEMEEELLKKDQVKIFTSSW